MTCSNEICERAPQELMIFLEFDSISLYFTQISLNSLNFWITSFSFLKFPWNSLNFWSSLKNSLRRSKFLRFRQKRGNFLESGSTGIIAQQPYIHIAIHIVCPCVGLLHVRDDAPLWKCKAGLKLGGTSPGTVKAPVFGTLNGAISNFQTWFVRTVMEVLKHCWM